MKIESKKASEWGWYRKDLRRGVWWEEGRSMWKAERTSEMCKKGVGMIKKEWEKGYMRIITKNIDQCI